MSDEIPGWALSKVNPGLWPEEWLNAWAIIGWLASTDLLQADLTRSVTLVAKSITVGMRELQTKLANFEMQVENLGERLDWAIKASTPKVAAKKGKRR